LAACGAKDDESDSAAATSDAPATTSQSVDEQLEDLSEYKLSMDKIDRYIAVQRSLAQRAAAMSPAERKAMGEKYGNSNNANASLDDMTRNIAEHPLMSAAVREGGLSPREFTMITMSMMQSAMAASVLKMRPDDDQDSLAREMKVNPDNIKFYQQHEAEIARKTNELQAEMKRLGMTEEG
jgi:hypothetical protein